MDATVASSDIKYPTDIDLLNQCREYYETAINILWAKLPHTGHKLPYSAKNARKSYLNVAKSKRWTAKKLRKAIGEQLDYINKAQKQFARFMLLAPDTKLPYWLLDRAVGSLSLQSTFRPSSDLIEFTVMEPTPDIVKMLELRSSSVMVYKFTRIRKVNGEPLMLETSFYPQYIYPGLTRELLQTHSFYSLLYDVGVVPYTAVDSYEAVKFSKADAELLHCRAGSAGFFIQRQTRTESGECYEFTQSYMRGDRASLDIVMHKDGVTFSRSVDKSHS